MSVERVISPPGHQKGLWVRLRVIADEKILIVRVRPAIEAYVRSVVAGAAGGLIIVAKGAATHVVIGDVDETILRPAGCLALVGIKEIFARMCEQHLSTELSDLVNPQLYIEPAKRVVLIDEPAIGPQKPDE